MQARVHVVAGGGGGQVGGQRAMLVSPHGGSVRPVHGPIVSHLTLILCTVSLHEQRYSIAHNQ